MATSVNPLFGPPSPNQGQPQGTLINPSAPNPLLGWGGASGVNPAPAPTPTPTSPAAPAGTSGSTNPFGQGSRGGGNQGFNLAETNLQTGLFKNALLPLFSNLSLGTGGDAANFFRTLMNLGGPFYQQKQRQSFEQGTQQAQNAAAQSRQQLQASGAGYTPSGTAAGLFGGESQAEAGNQAELFLNNLFQNEQLQALGAQGLSQIAQLFNPAALTGQQTNTQIQQPTNEGAQWLQSIGSLLGGATSIAQSPAFSSPSVG